MILLLFAFANAGLAQVTDTLPNPPLSQPDQQAASSTLQPVEATPSIPLDSNFTIRPFRDSTITDSSATVTILTEDKSKKKKKRREDFPNPKKALLSAIIPGGGQIYNRRWIKAVVVTGGTGGLIWNIVYTNRQYRRLERAHFYRIDENPDTVDEFTVNGIELISTSSLLRQRDDFRKKRETAYIWLIAFMSLSGLEAFVDAHLMTFDVNDDLSMRLKPQLDMPAFGGAALGMSLEFQLGQKKAPLPRPFHAITDGR